MKNVILFVHGFGSSHRCWTPLLTLLRKDDRITSRFELAYWDYPTSWFSLNPLERIPNLQELGRAMGEEIDSPRYRDRELTLIGHSQGGLVIQSWIAAVLNKGLAKTFLGNIRQVLLIATPNTGSTTASGLRVLVSSLLANPQEITLRVLCPAVAEMESVIRERCVYATEDSPSAWRVPIHAFCGMQDAIVKEASARGCFDSVKSVPGNHFSILTPARREDRRYSELVERLLDPGGHAHRFEIDLHKTVLRVEPREPSEIRIENSRNSRTVYYDNFAVWQRTIHFARSNRCTDHFTIRYKTRKDGYVIGTPSHPNLAPLAEISRSKESANEFRFDFKPESADDCRLTVNVYKGFDAGEREIHFHLGNQSFFREIQCELDLSMYIKAGYCVIDGPSCYFQNEDHECNELCRDRSISDLVPPIFASLEDGKWQFRLTNVRSGVVLIVWDVAPRSKALVATETNQSA